MFYKHALHNRALHFSMSPAKLTDYDVYRFRRLLRVERADHDRSRL